MVKRDQESAVLFVCTGNICRSPLAAGIFAAQVRNTALAKTLSDSAGMHAMVGYPADPLALDVAESFHADISAHRARQFEPADFENFDYLIALDFGHLDYLRATKPKDCTAEIALLMQFYDGPELEVPDPYGRSRKYFDRVAKLIEQGVRGMLEELHRGVRR